MDDRYYEFEAIYMELKLDENGFYQTTNVTSLEFSQCTKKHFPLITEK